MSDFTKTLGITVATALAVLVAQGARADDLSYGFGSVVHRQLNNVQQSYMPQNMGLMPQNQGLMPQSQGLITSSPGLMPQNMGLMPQRQGLMPQPQLLPTQQYLSPTSRQLFPQSTQLLPQSMQLFPQPMQLFPQSLQLLPVNLQLFPISPILQRQPIVSPAANYYLPQTFYYGTQPFINAAVTPKTATPPSDQDRARTLAPHMGLIGRW